MLTKIIVKNIKAIGKCEMDFTKKKYSYLEDNVLQGLVNPVAIYGHNGSGKSSFFYAIQQFIYLMILPVDNLFPFEGNYFKFNNLLNKENRTQKDIDECTSFIELYFSLEGDNYVYHLETSPLNRIEKELLIVNNNVVIERKNGMEFYNNKITMINNNRSNLVATLRYLASTEVDDQIIQKAYTYLSSFTFVDLPKQSSQGGYVTSKLFSNMNTFDLIANKSSEVKEILKGYKEFPLYSVEKIEDLDLLKKANPYVIKFDGVDGDLPAILMSDGMRNSSVLLSILTSIPHNSVLFVDELNITLHPTAALSFMKEARNRNIQLVFSSHNTHFLQYLRPDQIYFAKWKQGESKYYRLSDIYPNIREINNIEKMYLGNVFEVGE